MNQEELEFIQKCYSDYLVKKGHYEDINRYYYGNTDSLVNFVPREGRSNLKVNLNFIQKLVDEEAQYSFGNDITYTNLESTADVVKDINYNLKNNKADHDINLGIDLIKYGMVFEISYMEKIEDNYKFKNKIVSPLNGYMYIEDDKIKYFLHIFQKQLETEKTYIDVYTDKSIYHFDDTWNEVIPVTTHVFGIVPVGFGTIGGKQYNIDRGYEEGDKTIYNTIKTIQDAYETNLSDAVCEISDQRNAILKIFGIEAENEKDKDGNDIIDKDTGKPKKKAPVVRDNCILLFGDKTSQDAEWLLKNINDSFLKNTRDDLKDLIYTLTSHIDNNEKMQSNLSGIALRSRLQSLEAKCKMNEKAMTNIINTRLQCLFRFLDLTEGKKYDVNKIKIQFTPNIPVDETSIADMISKLVNSGVVSKETLRSWLPRIENVAVEGEKVKKEEKEELTGIGDVYEQTL